MNGLKTVACSKCGVPIAWVTSERGRQMPVDPEPTERGNVFCAFEKGRVVGRVRHKGAPRPRGIAFMPHFATCEAINRGRKPKENKPCKPEPEAPATLFDGL